MFHPVEQIKLAVGGGEEVRCAGFKLTCALTPNVVWVFFRPNSGNKWNAATFHSNHSNILEDIKKKVEIWEVGKFTFDLIGRRGENKLGNQII